MSVITLRYLRKKDRVHVRVFFGSGTGRDSKVGDLHLSLEECGTILGLFGTDQVERGPGSYEVKFDGRITVRAVETGIPSITDG